MTTYQPFPVPATQEEANLYRASGRMVTITGDPLPTERRACRWCEGLDDGDTCVYSVSCEDCGAGPGYRCVRPSQHEVPAVHKCRIDAAEAMDDAREAAGDPTLPARWAPAQEALFV